MDSIESLGLPLVYRVAGDAESSSQPTTAFITEVRALEGMQKEALVTCRPEGARWRLACDEGPYLNGKDMAPFPLAFFSAGMLFSFLSRFFEVSRSRGVALDSVSFEQDNFYTMEGSFLRGDARGGAKPAALSLKLSSSASESVIADLVREAKASSSVQNLMRTALRNTFSLTLNGDRRPVPDLAASPETGEDPAACLDNLAPVPDGFLPDIITQLKKAETVHGVEGGAGSSLKMEQKRTLHIHCEGRLVEGSLMEAVIDLHKPIGGSWRFVCDESGRTPPPLAYLSAGIGFCYMTQLGRYAKIAKHSLDGYRIVQETVFPGSSVEPVNTHVFLDADFEDESEAWKLVSIGQQTCFLHAAMRGEFPSAIEVELNGKALTL